MASHGTARSRAAGERPRFVDETMKKIWTGLCIAVFVFESAGCLLPGS